jgi:hypothetical protein
MHFQRAQQVKLGVRQLNWLRLTQLHKVLGLRSKLQRLIFRAGKRDAGLQPLRWVFSQTRQRVSARTQRLERATSRCFVSGRSRQVQRQTQLARMHYRAAFTAGLLPSVFLRRP